MKERDIEAELKAIKQMVGEIYVALVSGKRIEGVDDIAYRRAIEAAAGGDVSGLADYVKRGGKIPVNGGRNSG